MKNIFLKITGLTLALFVAIGINSCVKDDFDQPPVLQIPVGEVKTVAEMHALADIHGEDAPLRITEDISLFGKVTMGEQSGNLYKQAVFQDVTGGIMLSFLGSTSLNVGDSIMINLNGARVYNYHNLPQIDSLDITDNVQKLSAGHEVTIPEVNIKELVDNKSDYVGLVVKVTNAQFVDEELGSIFAADQVTENRHIEGPTGAGLLIRTSGYSNFASKTLPEGSGSLVAFVSIYNEDAQLIIRSYDEIDMNGDRFEVNVGGANSTIKDVKALYQGERLQITDSVIFEATVIANDESGNYYKSIVVQDDERGIEININDYDLYNSFAIGQKIVVNCYHLYLDTDGGVIQLGGVYDDNGSEEFGGIQPENLNAHIQTVAGGSEPDPIVSTINGLNDDYLGMLLELQNVEFIESELGETYADADNQYSENRTLSDCNGNQVTVRTSGYADFAGQTLAQGNGTFVGVFSAYNGSYQFFIRDLIDVDLTGVRCDGGGGGGSVEPVDVVDEDFSSQQDFEDISINNWTVVSVAGTRNWQGKTFDNEVYAQATGYNSGLAEMETWMITPPVTNISGKVLSFKSAKAYWEHTINEPLTVLISTDFVGDNFETATWTELNVNIANENSADHAWIESGEVDLSAFSGNAAIAFKYVGSDSESTSIRIDDVLIDVSGGGGGGGGSVDPVDEINEDFQSFSEYDEIDIEGWTSLHVTGDRNWIAQTFDNEVYVQASGYNSGSSEMETWLITPPVTNIQDKTLSFKSAIAYWAHGSGHPAAVLVSTDFVGDNFETATWTEIDVTLAQQSDGDHTWIESGEYDLSAFSGNAAIAFRYIGSDTESTSFRVDDIVVTDGSGGGGGGGTVNMINEDFSSQTNYEDIAIDGWVNINVEGDRKWQGKTFETETYAQATGYNSGLAAMEVWLITPKVTDIGSKSLSLKTAMAYWAHGSDSPLTVYVSEDYDGENYETATWVEISVPMANQNSGDHNWVDSGDVDLSNFDGDAAIAFKFVGSATLSTSFRLDDILIQ